MFTDEPGKQELLEQDTRNDIVHAILANPNEGASFGEIHYITGYAESNVHEHLDRMEDGEVVKRITEPSNRTLTEPDTFYFLTSEAEDILEDEGLLDEEKLEEYRGILDNFDGRWEYTDEQIKTYLEADRPEI